MLTRVFHRIALVGLLAACVTAGGVAAQPDAKKDKSARDTPLKSKDEAKFFGEEAWTKFQAAADRLNKEKSTDFLMETFEKPPGGKMPSAADREKFFRELAAERVKAEKLKGVYVLICKNPTYLYVDVTANSGLTPEAGKKVRDSLLSAFREKKYDDGLTKAVQVVLDAKGLGEKK